MQYRGEALMKWTERSFSFGYAVGYLPFLIERLSTTAPRLEELIDGLSDELLVYKPGGAWSAKEHVGHLSDLEQLHLGRLDDFESKLGQLRPADMTNRRTEEANHNATNAEDLVTRFRETRGDFFRRLERLETACLEHKAMHPRLLEPINVPDMLYFMAEHDVHHLTIMSRLLHRGP